MPPTNDEKPRPGTNINFDRLVTTGPVVIAGRDGAVTVTTGGNVDSQTTQTITVGGVETTRESLESMMRSLQDINTKIEEESFDEEMKEAALHDLQIIEKQLTDSKKPNARILIGAAKTLYRLSPMLASGIFALFGEPLVSQIAVGVGGIAVQFIDALRKRHAGK